MSSITTLFDFFFLLLLLVCLPMFSVAQTYSNISLGSSLIATIDNSTSWPSPSGEFAFGFRPLENNLFLLAIWFDKIPDKTIVWNAEVNVSTPRGSKVELTTDGKLVLNDPQGKELWEARQINGTVSYAAMLDNGNFILASMNSSGYSWETFKNPTDTILPTQTIAWPSTRQTLLYSRQTKTTYSKGRFRLRLMVRGNLVLYPVVFRPNETDGESYYNLTRTRGNKPTYGSQLVFDEAGEIYIVPRKEKSNERIVNLTWENIVPRTDVYYRATLDFDGVFTQYFHPRTFSGNNKSWSIMRSLPDDICAGMVQQWGSGACGDNGYCKLTAERRPSCECPPGYVFKDPNNKFGGCNATFTLEGCQEGSRTPEDLFEMKTMRNAEWSISDYEKLNLQSETDCSNSCMNDCPCAIALYREGSCQKTKLLPVRNGRFAENVSALIKVKKGIEQNTCRSKNNRSTLILVVSLLLGSSLFLNLLLLARACLAMFFKTTKKARKKNQESSVSRSNLRSFTYQELEEATDGFKEELGNGSFGAVYKGVIEEMGSSNYVAVKKLGKVVQEGEKEFKSEVNIIGQTHHKNLVRLLGFCEEGQHRLLVYEFMSNSNLAVHLFGVSKPDWNQRIQIAFGIARGIVYLHEDCSTQIIHCDIKPQNILLDDSFTARISDFGLAKLLMNDQTRTLTGIRGTKGYVAPEWFKHTPVTVKVDVYSFGVMLLEIICCRKGVELEQSEEKKVVLTDWAYDCYVEGKLHDLVDNDGDALNNMRMLERLVMIAIWCIQDEPSLRPSMKKVTQMLEGVLDVPAPPCPFDTYFGNFIEPKMS